MAIPHFLRIWFSPPYLYVVMPWWAWCVLLALAGVTAWRAYVPR